jgi:hypothetical protein
MKRAAEEQYFAVLEALKSKRLVAGFSNASSIGFAILVSDCVGALNDALAAINGGPAEAHLG